MSPIYVSIYLLICVHSYISKHLYNNQYCKLTRRRSNLIAITVITLWLHRSSSSYFTHKWRKENLFGYIWWNQNIFVLLNSFLIKGVIIKQIQCQSYVHFTLVWHVISHGSRLEIVHTILEFNQDIFVVWIVRLLRVED